MTLRLRTAQLDDVRHLVELMTEFYAESDYPLQPGRAAAAFTQLIDHEHFGRVWIMEEKSIAVGYAVLTLGFSMEYGGLDAFVDDLFIRPAYRRRGLGSAALDAIKHASVGLAVRALHLEVDPANDVAQRLYRNAGFEDNGRQLLTLRLAPPLHVAE